MCSQRASVAASGAPKPQRGSLRGPQDASRQPSNEWLEGGPFPWKSRSPKMAVYNWFYRKNRTGGAPPSGDPSCSRLRDLDIVICRRQRNDDARKVCALTYKKKDGFSALVIADSVIVSSCHQREDDARKLTLTVRAGRPNKKLALPTDKVFRPRRLLPSTGRRRTQTNANCARWTTKRKQ